MYMDLRECALGSGLLYGQGERHVRVRTHQHLDHVEAVVKALYGWLK